MEKSRQLYLSLTPSINLTFAENSLEDK